MDQLQVELTGIVRCLDCQSDFMPSYKEIFNHFNYLHMPYLQVKYCPPNPDNIHPANIFAIRSMISRWLKLFAARDRQLKADAVDARTRQLKAYAARTRQWKVLRLLRTEFNSRHRRFLCLAAQSELGLMKLRKACRGSAKLLTTGILTSKDILQGHSPVSLERVFSLLLLSYAMAAVRDPGRSDSISPLRSDFSVWRQSLSKEAERQTFDILVSVMWPDVSSQLNDRMVPSEEKEASDRIHDTLEDSPGLSDLGHFPVISPEMVQTSMLDTVSSIFDDSSADEFDLSIFLNMERFDEPSVTGQLSPQPSSSTLADVNLRGSTISPTDEKENIHEPVSVKDLLCNIFILQILRFMICEL